MGNKYHDTIPSLAFMVRDVQASQLVFNITMKSMDTKNVDVILFFDRLGKNAHAHLNAQIHISEAYNYTGPVIATCLKTAHKLIQFPSPCPKFFFLNDLEWLRYPQKNYHTLEAIYRNPELTILTRCEDHKILFENCWNKPVYKIIENYHFFTPEFLTDIFQKTTKSPVKPIQYKNIYEYI